MDGWMDGWRGVLKEDDDHRGRLKDSIRKLDSTKLDELKKPK